MDKLRVFGGKKLFGSVDICTSKNALLPILAGCVLSDGIVELNNVPNFSDIEKSLDILKSLGAGVIRFDDNVQIDATNIDRQYIDYNLGKDIRASILYAGSLLAKFKKAVVCKPGGCNIGARPVDLHIAGLKALGVKIEENHGYLFCDGSNMKSGVVEFAKQSVGATENIMLASVFLNGKTTIKNCAKEPEIVDLANFLNKMGAKIFGAGTSKITILGTDKLHGINYTAIPDRIVAGTFMVAAAITGGNVEICHVLPKHVESITKKLLFCGCKLDIKSDRIKISAEKRCKSPKSLTTGVYPKFPTDMQSIFLPLLATSKGTCVVKEKIFETRFKCAGELTKMGANIQTFCDKAVVHGVKNLSGANVVASDLRAGAGLVLAGLVADGYTTVENVNYIDRGYPKIETDLQKLGAEIERIWVKNKRLAIFLGIFVGLALVIVLSSAVFALDNVTIKYHNATNILSGDENIIIESAGFRYGENVFLSNKNNYIKNIESSNPYIRVLNIETVFPNKYIIHAIEREETYVFKTDNYYIVTDENLKVLDKQKSFTNSVQNGIVVENSDYSTSTVKEGEFLAQNEYYAQIFKCFGEWKATQDKKPDYDQIKSQIKSITVGYVDGLNSGDGNLLVTMWNGIEILIDNSTVKMSDKLNFGFSAFERLDGDINRITVFENANGEIVGVYN